MIRRRKVERRKSAKDPITAHDFDQLLDIFLALDRTVVEVSMHVYGVPRRHRLALRRQNRLLHETIRKRLPRPVQPTG